MLHIDLRKLIADVHSYLGVDIIAFLNGRKVASPEDAATVEKDLKACIKAAFRKLSVKHHPDKTGGDDALFKKMSDTYALAIKELRVQYSPPVPMQQIVVHFEFYAQPFYGGTTTATYGNGTVYTDLTGNF